MSNRAASSGPVLQASRRRWWDCSRRHGQRPLRRAAVDLADALHGAALAGCGAQNIRVDRGADSVMC